MQFTGKTITIKFIKCLAHVLKTHFSTQQFTKLIRVFTLTHSIALKSQTNMPASQSLWSY